MLLSSNLGITYNPLQLVMAIFRRRHPFRRHRMHGVWKNHFTLYIHLYSPSRW